MRWKTFARWELRRRAVVCGRAFDKTGNPFTDAANLWLCRVPDETAPVASKRRRKTEQAASDLPDPHASRVRRHACHMRRDGSFFFLDVEPGRYVLNRFDEAGAIVQTKAILLPPFDRQAKVPIVSIEFEIVERTSETDSSSGPASTEIRTS